MADQGQTGATGQLTPMGGWYNGQFQLSPDFVEYFQQQNQMIGALNQNKPPNLNQQDLQAYDQYLWVLADTINSVIPTGRYVNYEDFNKEFENYGDSMNPRGKELYNKQYEYIMMKVYGLTAKEHKKLKKQHEKTDKPQT